MKTDRNAIVEGEYCAAPHAAQELHGCDPEVVLSIEDLKRLNGHLHATSQSALSLMNDALPADDAHTIESLSPSERINEEPNLEGIIFFLVDDEPLVKKTLERPIRRYGGAVVAEASNGKEALEECGALPPGAAVIMDDRMPNMFGTDAAPLIKEKRPDLHIFLLSGTAQPEQLKALMDSGVLAAFFRKPVDINAMLRTISSILRQAALE